MYAAASLKTALDKVAEVYEAATGEAVTLVYAGSSALARQISFGAPADVFVSASDAWMDWLAGEGRVVAGTRTPLLGNRLVLISADQVPAIGVLSATFDFDGALGEGRLALALADAVPVGIYARQALTSLGLWDTLAPRVAQADNARATLALVALGEAPLGIVYATDAAAEPRVHVLAEVPPSTHAPIRYPVAKIAGARPGAVGFIVFLRGPEAQEVFKHSGFEWAATTAP